MPRRDDISSVLVIGSGPIVIGQACEFDYSGTQACRVLREEGLRVVLVNSNPATIMTDPEFADATYIEPITPEIVTKVIEKERPDALLATLGGQTALNTAIALHEAGVLEQYGVELIGANVDAIQAGEDRQRFKEIVATIGAESARSTIARTVDELPRGRRGPGLPGGRSGRPSRWAAPAPAWPATRRSCGGWPRAGLQASPTTEVLLEESILGWKEYELELMRDKADNVVVVCSIENLDPMGVHTGDSITVAPAMTLTDREYQRLRDIAIDVIRAVGVDTGGCNIQFAVEPDDRPGHRHRDEPAGVAVLGAGVEGDRLPDRQDRGQAGDRLHPRRDPQRHHPRDPGVLRADAGLRRGQGAAVRLREVPRRRPDPDHAHEERRRGDGDRPVLHRGAAEGAAVAGAAPTRPSTGRRATGRGRRPARRAGGAGGGAARRPAARRAARAVGRRDASRSCTTRPASTRGSSTRSSCSTRSPPRCRTPRSSTATCCARAKRHGFSDVQLGRLRGMPEDVVRGVRHALGHPAGLQDRRHLRGGVRRPDALPLLVLRRGDRGRAAGRAGRAHPRQRAQPDRPGHRVRLLLRARVVRAARARASGP